MSYTINTNPHFAPGGIYPNQKLIREFLSYDMRFELLCEIKDKGAYDSSKSGFIILDKISTDHWSRQYELPWSIEATQIKPTDLILDAGCGYSSLKLALSKRAKKVYSIDIDLDALRESRKMLEELEIENVELICADIADYKTDLQYDKIFCISVLEHIPQRERILECFSNFKKLLKPGGSLIVTMDVALDGIIDNFNIDYKLYREILEYLEFSAQQLSAIDKLQDCRIALFYDKNNEKSVISAACFVYNKPL